MTIADQTDVEALLQRPLTADETGYLPALLTRADGLIAGHLPHVRFDGQVQAAETTIVPQSDTTEIWLPGRPVTSVASVTVDGDPLDPEGYSWAEWGDVARQPDGAVWARLSVIAVVWDYGLPAPPEAVVAVAADMVRWAVANPTGVRQESVGSGYGVTYDAATIASAVALTKDHKAVLNHYRYPVPV